MGKYQISKSKAPLPSNAHELDQVRNPFYDMSHVRGSHEHQLLQRL